MADYFEMLADEKARKAFSKSQHNESLRVRLKGRTKSAIEMKYQENNCLDPASREGWAKKHAESPGDPVLTRLYALCLGLCELVETDRVELGTAIELFEQERSRSVIGRFRDEASRKRETVL